MGGGGEGKHNFKATRGPPGESVWLTPRSPPRIGAKNSDGLPSLQRTFAWGLTYFAFDATPYVFGVDILGSRHRQNLRSCKGEYCQGRRGKSFKTDKAALSPVAGLGTILEANALKHHVPRLGFRLKVTWTSNRL